MLIYTFSLARRVGPWTLTQTPSPRGFLSFKIMDLLRLGLLFGLLLEQASGTRCWYWSAGVCSEHDSTTTQCIDSLSECCLDKSITIEERTACLIASGGDRLQGTVSHSSPDLSYWECADAVLQPGNRSGIVRSTGQAVDLSNSYCMYLCDSLRKFGLDHERSPAFLRDCEILKYATVSGHPYHQKPFWIYGSVEEYSFLVEASSPGICMALCQSVDSSCVAWSWQPGDDTDGLCVLKSAEALHNAVSGTPGSASCSECDNLTECLSCPVNSDDGHLTCIKRFNHVLPGLTRVLSDPCNPLGSHSTELPLETQETGAVGTSTISLTATSSEVVTPTIELPLVTDPSPEVGHCTSMPNWVEPSLL
eukprot:Blabericola_migrator_1__3225@NODE_194_length_11541_cov_124_962524_g167_i0_p4_GENE_NODE_194_length_11541_cov_124_962524_g167_i0NODE_194_length_11541_cov_124_962524_g167_i0_p4_ORF_typecomplete_len364_score33_84PAN_4/PF14295_6/1_5e04PAN_4/PF14295_6/4_7e03PAN_4/PF14295_6/1e06PAN_4/PF14295_6/1_8e04PAN_1/PF00024_26/3e03PAN_1/PF00024_26/0_0045PAN_1/PF00024_26/4_5e03_NODE_194_length_11541_cov_124_962524_g167_i020723163